MIKAWPIFYIGRCERLLHVCPLVERVGFGTIADSLVASPSSTLGQTEKNFGHPFISGVRSITDRVSKITDIAIGVGAKVRIICCYPYFLSATNSGQTSMKRSKTVDMSGCIWNFSLSD